MNTRLGRCYELSYKATAPGTTLVHGSIQGFDFPRIDHAWVVLADGTVWEPASNEVWDAGVFRSFFRAVVGTEYTFADALHNALESGHYGPW